MSPSASVAPFAIRSVHRDDVVRVSVEGELDLHAVPLLRQQLARLEATSGHTIIFDLRALSFIDLAGFRSLLSTYGGARWGWVLLVAAQAPVRRLFTLCGLGYLLIPDPAADDGAVATVPDGGLVPTSHRAANGVPHVGPRGRRQLPTG